MITAAALLAANWPFTSDKITARLESATSARLRIHGFQTKYDGVAHFSNLSYSLPGVVANVHGTFSFADEKIDLHGEMRVDTKFSKTEGGPKSLLTRATEGLFAKGRGNGEILPVKLTGTYDHPSDGLDK